MRLVAFLASVLMLLSACSDHETTPTPSKSLSDGPTSVAPDDSVAATNSLVVPTKDDVLGNWRVVEVAGVPPPRDAERGLRMSLLGNAYWLSWSDGVNEHIARWGLSSTGTFRSWHDAQTAVGCIGKCTHPGGFGVDEARALRMTRTGKHLVLIGVDGTELARYRRVG